MNPLARRRCSRSACFFTFARDNFGALAFARLSESRTEIERELGIPVTWSSEDGKHRAATSTGFKDLRAPGNRNAIKQALATQLERFASVFRPVLRRSRRRSPPRASLRDVLLRAEVLRPLPRRTDAQGAGAERDELGGGELGR